MRAATTLLTLLISTLVRGAEPVPSPADDPELSEIVVTAPQPRYVAPTTRDRIGRVWVPVHINDKGPYRLVLDTGATNSAVIQRVVNSLGVSPEQTRPVRLRGVTGTAIAPAMRADSISVGDLWVGPATIPIVDDAFGGAEGLLGTEGMQTMRILIDFRNDFINISRSRNRRASTGYETIPFLKDETRLLVVRAKVGFVPVRAIIDTGAQASVGNGALQAALRRQVARNSRGVLDEITGATGDVQTGIGARISPIEIGGLSIRDAHLTFGDMHIFDFWNLGDEPAILVGMDIIGLLESVVIDYKRRELHIKARSGRSPPR